MPKELVPREADPRDAVAVLAASVRPYLLGVRHHSPALAVALPALLDTVGADVVCVELPADFQPWLPYLADPATVAPVALAGAGRDGGPAFYPFADFSPELVAIRWARERGVEVRCCDLPLTEAAWHTPEPAQAATGTATTPATARETATAQAPPAAPGAVPRTSFAAALASSGTGREGDDMWDRAVEVLAPGCEPEAVRRAALGVGWALRRDAEAAGGVPARDLAREAHMRRVLVEAVAGGGQVVAVVGAFHAPALISIDTAEPTARAAAGELAELAESAARTAARAPERPPAGDASTAAGRDAVTSLVPYAFDLLDSRSGYPAGIRDPRWQQAVFVAGGDPGRVRDGAARAITDLCRELRAAGHTAGTGEAVETLRLACDLARLRGLPAPGRGELLEAVTTVLGQGEPLGRGRALARALDTVLVGAARGRTAPGT
ncbi:DUF5682 family protein, partial [Nonomuraea lactucae]|uniref:DUF5682 family protein n=1 Tax=Nonomuraea lactucae TaxID=2249762 RepID=UPI001F06384F